MPYGWLGPRPAPPHQNSPPFCIPAMLNKAPLSRCPHPKNDRPPAPRFISRFEVPRCWDRAEPRKRGPNWMLILVSVPEMSGAFVISAVPLYLLSGIITFSERQMEGPHHNPPNPPNRFKEFSVLMTHGRRCERARCALLSQSLVLTRCCSQRRENGRSSNANSCAT